MARDSNRDEPDTLEAKLAKAVADAEVAKRRSTMSLRYAREALKLSASTPRIGAMLREIDKELENT